MKRIVAIIFLFISVNSYAQNTTSLPAGTSAVSPVNIRRSGTDSLASWWFGYTGGYNRILTATEFFKNYEPKYAKLAGGNSFTGNQSINGSLTSGTIAISGNTSTLGFYTNGTYHTIIDQGIGGFTSGNRLIHLPDSSGTFALSEYTLPKNNPTFTGVLSSINQTPINNNWLNPLTSVFFASSHDSNDITLQSGIGGAAINLIDSSQSQNNREVSWMFIDGAMTARSHKDNTVKKRDLFTLDTLGNGRFLSNIFQNGNQVANDNTVVHNTGNETGLAGNKTWTGSQTAPDFTASSSGKFITINNSNIFSNYGNSINFGANDITLFSTRIDFRDKSSNTYMILGNGSDGPLSYAPHLRVTNKPVLSDDVVNKRSGDSLYVGKNDNTYIKNQATIGTQTGVNTINIDTVIATKNMRVKPIVSATSSTDQNSPIFNLTPFFWNTTTAQSTFASIGLQGLLNRTAGVLSSEYLSLTFPTSIPANVPTAFNITARNNAISGTNYNSPELRLYGSHYNSGAKDDLWSLQHVIGTGTQPTSTLLIQPNAITTGLRSVFINSNLKNRNTWSPGTPYNVLVNVNADSIQRVVTLKSLADSLDNQNKNEFDVSKYGIYPDGNDYTSQMQALLNTAGQNTTFGQVRTFFFPNGNYIFSTLTLPQHCTVEFRGESQLTSLQLKAATNASLIIVKPSTYFYMHNLSLDGNKSNQSVTGLSHAIEFKDTTSAAGYLKSGWFHDFTIRYFDGDGIHGGQYRQDCHMWAGEISSCNGYGIYDPWNSADWYCNNMHVVSSGLHNVYIGTGMTYSYGSSATSLGSGFYLTTNVRSANITGNYIKYNNHHGIEAYGNATDGSSHTEYSGLIISGNWFEDNSQTSDGTYNNIDLTNTIGPVISGNDFLKSPTDPFSTTKQVGYLVHTSGTCSLAYINNPSNGLSTYKPSYRTAIMNDFSILTNEMDERGIATSGTNGITTIGSGAGLHVYGSTNSIDITPGIAGSYDNLNIIANRANKNTGVSIIPNGTATAVKQVFYNNSSLTNVGTGYVAADADTMRIAMQNIGTPTTPVSSLAFGVGGGTTGGANWNNLMFYASSKIAFNRSIRLPLTGLLKGNGGSSDVTAISGTSSQFVMGDGSVVTMIATNSTTTGLTSATLNSTYPSVPTGFRVICDSITSGGAIYVKATGTKWLTISAPVAP